jgi:hypothetical protein
MVIRKLNRFGEQIVIPKRIVSPLRRGGRIEEGGLYY